MVRMTHLISLVSGTVFILLILSATSAELTVGFTDRSAVSVEEGKVVTICANLTSPKAVDRSALLQARTVPLTAKGEHVNE